VVLPVKIEREDRAVEVEIRVLFAGAASAVFIADDMR
jgi:hypothetical protein